MHCHLAFILICCCTAFVLAFILLIIYLFALLPLHFADICHCRRRRFAALHLLPLLLLPSFICSICICQRRCCIAAVAFAFAGYYCCCIINVDRFDLQFAALFAFAALFILLLPFAICCYYYCIYLPSSICRCCIYCTSIAAVVAVAQHQHYYCNIAFDIIAAVPILPSLHRRRRRFAIAFISTFCTIAAAFIYTTISLLPYLT